MSGQGTTRRRKRINAGRKVGGGRLRVDAARALHKLREYQLPEPAMWVLEATRGLVGLGATGLKLRGDSDDVWLSAAGIRLDPEDASRLLDELVSPSGDLARRPLRLLATGINTALGMRPRWLDLLCVPAQGGTMRVRYEPHLLETEAPPGEETQSGLHHLAPEPCPTPAGLTGPALMLQLRRRLGWQTVSLYVSGREPPELPLLRAEAAELEVPLRVGDDDSPPAPAAAALVSVPLGRIPKGYLALVEPRAAESGAPPGARLDIAELGVRIASHRIALGDREPRGPLPLRVRVDGPRMPTNASRSQVPLDQPPVSTALARAGELMTELVNGIVTAAESAPPAKKAKIREAVLALIGGFVGGRNWRGHLIAGLPATLQPLVDLPLLRDAVGRFRTIRDLARRPRDYPLVHTGSEPLPETLSEWVGDLLWVDAGSARLLGAWQPGEARSVLREVRRKLELRDNWLRHPQRAPTLGDTPGTLLRISLDLPAAEDSCTDPVEGLPDDLQGELCLLEQGSAEIVYQLDGREIARERPLWALPIRGLVETSALRPQDDYQGVRQDETLHRIRMHLAAMVVRAVEELSRALIPVAGDSSAGDGSSARAQAAQADGPDWLRHPSPQQRALLADRVRAGIAFASNAKRFRGDPSELRELLAQTGTPLDRAQAWPRTDGSYVSIAQLRDGLNGDPVVRMTGPDAIASPLPSRPVLKLSGRERGLLRWCLPEGRDRVEYDRVGPDSREARAERLARELANGHGVALPFWQDGIRGAITWHSDGPAYDLHHAGVFLGRRIPSDRQHPVLVSLDDDRLVPNRSWNGLASDEEPELPGLGVERVALRDAVLALFASPDGPPAELAITPSARDGDIGRALFTNLLRVLGQTPQRERRRLIKGASVARLRQVALLEIAGRDQPVSLDELAEIHTGKTIPRLPADQVVDFVPDNWWPLRADKLLGTAVGWLLGKNVRDATRHIDHHRRTARMKQRLERHLASQLQVPNTLQHRDDAVEVGSEDGRVRGWVVLRRFAEPLIRLTLEGRSLAAVNSDVSYPLEAELDISPELMDPIAWAPSAEGERAIANALHQGARGVIDRTISERPQALFEDSALRKLVHAWLGVEKPAGDDRRVRDRLRDAPSFPTVQGGFASVAQASTERAVRVGTINGEWLEPTAKEKRRWFDNPVIALPAGSEQEQALLALLTNLGGDRKIQNVSYELERAQAARRVTQNKLPSPTLAVTGDVTLRRELRDILTTHQQETFGIGQVELAVGDSSIVQLFIEGKSVGQRVLGLSPSVRIAVESPMAAAALSQRGSLDKRFDSSLGKSAQQVAERYLKAVSGELTDAALSPGARQSLRRAWLRDVGSELLDDVPLFVTTADVWLTPNELLAAAESGRLPGKEQTDAGRELPQWDAEESEGGCLWYTPQPRSTQTPLDDSRFVLRLSVDDAASLSESYELRDADEHLAQDAEARLNLSRSPVGHLEIDRTRTAAALTVVRFEGEDGSHGVLAPLRPTQASLRCVRVHRNMIPLGEMPDPCSWPTATWVEDPALTPNRTFSRPEKNANWIRTRERIQEASEQSLSELYSVPGTPLEEMRVDFRLSSAILGGSGQARGVLWLDDPGQGEIRAHTQAGRSRERLERGPLSPDLPRVPVPVSGDLLVHADPRFVGPVRTLADGVWRRMVQSLAARVRSAELEVTDAVIAHLVVATLAGMELDVGLTVPCIGPGTSGLSAIPMAGALGSIRVARPDALPDDGRFYVVDDGSLASQMLIRGLRPRLERYRQPGPVSRFWGGEPEVTSPAPPPTPTAPVRKTHVLDPVAGALMEWLDEVALPGAPVERVMVDASARSPMVRFETIARCVWLAGRGAQLERLAASVGADELTTHPAFRLLCAHALGVLNRELQPVTDATEAGILQRLLSEA